MHSLIEGIGGRMECFARFNLIRDRLGFLYHNRWLWHYRSESALLCTRDEGGSEAFKRSCVNTRTVQFEKAGGGGIVYVILCVHIYNHCRRFCFCFPSPFAAAAAGTRRRAHIPRVEWGVIICSISLGPHPPFIPQRTLHTVFYRARG